MHLTLTAPDQLTYAGDIAQLVVPTESGEITILPGHQALISVIKPGIVLITPTQPADADRYLVVNGQIVMSIGKGLLAVHGNDIVITTALATANVNETEAVLTHMRADLEAQIAQIKSEGNQEALDDAIANLEKITAELRLSKVKHIIH